MLFVVYDSELDRLYEMLISRAEALLCTRAGVALEKRFASAEPHVEVNPQNPKYVLVPTLFYSSVTPTYALHTPMARLGEVVLKYRSRRSKYKRVVDLTWYETTMESEFYLYDVPTRHQAHATYVDLLDEEYLSVSEDTTQHSNYTALFKLLPQLLL